MKPNKVNYTFRIDPRDLAKAKELGIDLALLFRMALAMELRAREKVKR